MSRPKLRGDSCCVSARPVQPNSNFLPGAASSAPTIGTLIHGERTAAGTAVVAAVAGKLDGEGMAAHAYVGGYLVAEPGAAARNGDSRADNRAVHFEGQHLAAQTGVVG